MQYVKKLTAVIKRPQRRLEALYSYGKFGKAIAKIMNITYTHTI